MNRIMDTDELRSMKELINSNNEEDIRSSFIYYHQHLKHALNVSDDDPQNLRSSASIDTLSNVLKPEDCGLIAVKTLGNGNCLYNSVSEYFSSDDRHSTLLRYLVAAELYLNAEQYANHPVLREAQSDNRMFTDHIDTIFSLLLTDESCDEFDRVRCKNSTVKFEARLTCRNFRWSSLIHLLALVNIMDRPIFSVYPSVNEGFRSLFHRIIYPVRQYNYSESNNNQPTFGIMWTRDGDLDSRQGFRFEPNHFALMVRPEEVTNVGNDQCMGDTDSMDYESFATSRDSINVDPDTLFVSDDTNDDTNLNHSSNMDIDINSIPVNLENSPIPDVIPIVNETEADADTATCVSSTNPDFLSHDVGDIFGSISLITDEQKHVFLKDHFFPDENYTDFIKQHITKVKQKSQYTLSFQRSWLTQYPWLVYSPKQQ